MTHDTTPPKRIWVIPDASGVKHEWHSGWYQGRPNGRHRVEYILASETDALVAAALEPVMDVLMEPVATHTDSDWLNRRHDLLVQVTSAPAAAALDKLIAEAEARGRIKGLDEAAQIGGDAAVARLLRHEPDASPLKIQMTRQAIANPIRRAAKGEAK